MEAQKRVAELEAEVAKLRDDLAKKSLQTSADSFQQMQTLWTRLVRFYISKRSHRFSQSLANSVEYFKSPYQKCQPRFCPESGLMGESKR